MPGVAVKVVLAPLHKLKTPLMEAVAPPTVTLTGEDVAEQFGPLLTVTVYVPAELTVILCDVAPLLHW